MRSDPSILDAARARNAQECSRSEELGLYSGHPFEWRDILQQAPEDVARTITRPGPEMDRLRAGTPFEPMPDLTDERLRRDLWRRVRDRGGTPLEDR